MSTAGIPALTVFQEAAIDTALFQVAGIQLLTTDPALLEGSLLPGLDLAGLHNEGLFFVRALQAGRLVAAAQAQRLLVEELVRRRPHIATRFQSPENMRQSLRGLFKGREPATAPFLKTREVLERERTLTTQNTSWRGTFPVWVVQNKADLRHLKEDEAGNYVLVQRPDNSYEIRIALDGKHFRMLLQTKGGVPPERIAAAGKIQIHQGSVFLNGDGEAYQTTTGSVSSLGTLGHFAHPSAARTGLPLAKEIFEKTLGSKIPVITIPSKQSKHEESKTTKTPDLLDILGSTHLYRLTNQSEKHNYILIEDAMGNLHFRLVPEGKGRTQMIFEGEELLAEGEVSREQTSQGGIAFIIANTSGGSLSYVRQAEISVNFLRDMILPLERGYLHAMSIEEWTHSDKNPEFMKIQRDAAKAHP